MIPEHKSTFGSRLQKMVKEQTSLMFEKVDAELMRLELLQKKETELRKKSHSSKATAQCFIPPTIQITSDEKLSPQVVQRNYSTEKESSLKCKENKIDKIDNYYARESKRRSTSQNRSKELIPLSSNKRSQSENNLQKLQAVQDTRKKTPTKQQVSTNCLLNQAFISPKNEALIKYEAETKRILNQAFISPKNEASAKKPAAVNCSPNQGTILPKNEAISKQKTVSYGGSAFIKIEGIQNSNFFRQPFICLGNIQKLDAPLEIQLVLNNKGSQSGFAAFEVEVENFINVDSLHIVPQRLIIPPNTKEVVKMIYKPKYNEIKKIQSLQRERVCLYTINVTTGDLAAAHRVKT